TSLVAWSTLRRASMRRSARGTPLADVQRDTRVLLPTPCRCALRFAHAGRLRSTNDALQRSIPVAFARKPPAPWKAVSRIDGRAPCAHPTSSRSSRLPRTLLYSGVSATRSFPLRGEIREGHGYPPRDARCTRS